jgi:hypothetical protein
LVSSIESIIKSTRTTEKSSIVVVAFKCASNALYR